MILTDPAVVARLHPSISLVYFLEGFCMLAVVLIGKYLTHRRRDRASAVESIPEPLGPGLEKELIQS